VAFGLGSACGKKNTPNEELHTDLNAYKTV
jgi:hypothetical protein